MLSGTANYQALKSELNTDPAKLGYSGFVAVGNDVGCALYLNQIRTSGTVVGASGSYLLWRNDVSLGDIVDASLPADFLAMTQANAAKLTMLFTPTPVLDVTRSGYRTNLQNLFSGSATLLSGKLNSGVMQRFGSRAETLWGVGTVVSPSDVDMALRRTSG